MLPARFHIILAKSCLKLKKNLLTASYVGDEMKKLNKDVIDNNLIFLNEIGLDPGIDLMSAKKIIDNLPIALKPSLLKVSLRKRIP